MRNFYLLTTYQNPLFTTQVYEQGQLIKEYKNGLITQYYQADIFGVWNTVLWLTKTYYHGAVSFYIQSSLIAQEHEEFKTLSLTELRKRTKSAKTHNQKRWWYSALAHYHAQKNGIDLTIKHLERSKLKWVNHIMNSLRPGNNHV